MQNFSEIQEKVFQDCRNIVSELHAAESVEQFLAMEQKISGLQELLSFLKVSQAYSVGDSENIPLQIIDNQCENSELSVDEVAEDRYIAEEEVIFNNNFNQIDDSEIAHPETASADAEPIEEEVLFNNELNQINETENIAAAEDDSSYSEEAENIDVVSAEEEAETVVNISEIEDEELEAVEELIEFDTVEDEIVIQENADEKETDHENENRGKIVEYNIEQPEEKPEPVFESRQQTEEKHSMSHKLKLANIKGLKKVESLFDDDPLEHSVSSENTETGSLLKTNVSTDYMEAQKQKQEFRLDLNDKLAFSKMLFGGSQSELNETVNTLNGFSTLDEAKEYLSDLYYQKNWKKVDEYAQRLWDLVENKFQ